MDRVQAWERGERIAPITLDLALTTFCNYHCQYCAALGQTGQDESMSYATALHVIKDAAEIGVRGVVLMSDGENTTHPAFVQVIELGKSLGLSMACATNGYLVGSIMAEQILPYLDYLRINFSAGESEAYARIMGVSEMHYWRVRENIRWMVWAKRQNGWPVTINMQMVLRPQDADQIMPFALLAKDLGVDYAIIKHCLDYTDPRFGVDYSEYEKLAPLIRDAEALSDDTTFITAKWSKMRAGKVRSYKKCYGPPFLLQISGTGLMAACGPLFAERHSKYHIGNVNQTPLKELWQSDRYWAVMDSLRSEAFDTATECGAYGCVQDGVNRALDGHLKGDRICEGGEPPLHVNFV